MERVNVYVDGYNLYHGLKKMRIQDPVWQKFYWIDFVKFFDHFKQRNEFLQKVKYFTAPDHNPERKNRQNILFQANILLNGSRFEVFNGMFYRKRTTCKVCYNRYTIHEEKRTDVNISVQMLEDCILDSVDTLIIVSADSDLLPPMISIQKLFPSKKVKVFFPPKNKSGALTDFMNTIHTNIIKLERHKIRFQNSIMPDTLTKNGITYTIPDKWKIYSPSSSVSSPLPVVVNSICPYCNRTIIIP